MSNNKKLGIFLFKSATKAAEAAGEEISEADIDISSKDIDRSKFSPQNWLKMKEKFQHYYVDKQIKMNKERPYNPAEVDDETIARYLIARNDNFEKASELLESVVLNVLFCSFWWLSNFF